MEELESRSQHSHPIEYYDLEQSGSITDSQSGDDEAWCPGDGICPTETQLQSCYQASLDSWSQAVLSHDGASKSLDIHLKAFLGLLDNVPPFFHQPPKDIDLTGGKKFPLVLKSSLHLQTTGHGCSQQWKPIDYLQCLGFPLPTVYKTNVEQPPCSVMLATQELRPAYLTSIVLAWSYILSSRWVEILQSGGKDCALFHDSGDSTIENFWEVITQGRWLARVKSGRASSYSPWMLRGEDKRNDKSPNKRYQCTNSYEWVPSLPSSSVAFNILLDFCISDGLEREMLVGFASVLLLPSRNIPSPKLSPPAVISRPPNPFTTNLTIFHDIFRKIDKWITLSATQDALDSLLCSAFFDPTIPCNLVGSASSGIKEAISSDAQLDHQKLLDAVSWKKPHLSLLWYSLVVHDQASPILNMSLKRLPPICLVAAIWTNTIQTFLQVIYHSDSTTETGISRAEEFQISFYCRPETSVPWVAAPPFGSTTKRNLSLEIFAHVEHEHLPISWANFWVLRSGEKIQASKQYQYEHGVFQTQLFDTLGYNHLSEFKWSKDADKQSQSATSHLFNWHRHHDDGLWLDDGTSKIEDIRQLQHHPWIVDPFHDADRHDRPNEDNSCSPDLGYIVDWNSEVRKHCHTDPQSGL